MKRKKETSRRSFLKKSAITLAGIHIVPRFVLGKGFIAPSDKINLGFIGLGKQGQILSNFFLRETRAQIVAGAEVWDIKRQMFEEHVSRKYAELRNVEKYNGIQTYLDYKQLLDRADIDGIVIATPDHWHGIQCVDALEAGKDVYCEKPLTNTIQEGIDIVNAVKKGKRIFQTGSMQRSWEIFRKAKEIVSSGKLGDIQRVVVNVGEPARDYDLPVEKTPEGIDWNLWCGPAPMKTYHNSIAPNHWKTYPAWRDFKEYGTGRIGDWGAHMFDIAQWALDKDHTGPISYIPPDDENATRGMKMYYDDGIEMVHEDFGRGWAVRFIGQLGVLDVSRSFLETLPSSILHPDPEKADSGGYTDYGNHYQDWLSNMITRKQTLCDAEVGHRSATISNIANIAYSLRRKLEWDPVKEVFIKDKEANKMRMRENRDY